MYFTQLGKIWWAEREKRKMKKRIEKALIMQGNINNICEYISANYRVTFDQAKEMLNITKDFEFSKRLAMRMSGKNYKKIMEEYKAINGIN